MVTINKIILSLLLFSHVIFAMELEVFSNKTYGTVSLKVTELTVKGAKVKSNSNIFSVNGDKSFGVYKIDSDISIIMDQLKKIELKMNKLEQTLALANSSLSTLYKGEEHDFYIKFNNKLVSNKSPFYEKIKKQIDKIVSISNKKIILEYKLIDSDLSTIEQKRSITSIFDKEKNCSGSAKSGICKILNEGFISL